jgi:hypothetical protein
VRRESTTHCSGSRVRSGLGNDLYGVSDLEDSLGEDVGPDASAVDEWAQDRPRCVAVDDSAGFAETHALTAHAADSELASDQAVQIDSSRNHVAAMIVHAEGWVERVAHLRLAA